MKDQDAQSTTTTHIALFLQSQVSLTEIAYSIIDRVELLTLI